ncbi:MAG: hypothetical protein PF637_01820 [Spirochaetes bacterium]|nr:hypothetical protein [Spirochaetota bacterium]
MENKAVYEDIKKKIDDLSVVSDEKLCKATEKRLETCSYAPPFLIEIPEFITLDKKGAQKALQTIYEYPESVLKSYPITDNKTVDQVKNITMNAFYKEFALLQDLRNNVPEAWDQINELYEDD